MAGSHIHDNLGEYKLIIGTENSLAITIGGWRIAEFDNIVTTAVHTRSISVT